MFERINKKVKGLFSSQRMKTLALMLLVGTTAAMAQNAAGDYSAGTTALTTVTEENAFWLNHTQIKYDKMNVKLKKTRYKRMIYEYNPNLKLLKQVCNKFDFSGNNCRNITNFVPTD
ncbi:hypothetical protein ACNOHN_12330 [Bacteroides zhangwenhongii]|uniref:hypothetical protein n=1 Tax=Bacteroides zhangwenhongii TaxID=2650157 RepID=UPI003AAE7ECC